MEEEKRKLDQVVGETGEMYRRPGNRTEVYSSGRWRTGDSHQKVPDARKARCSQDPKGMKLAEIHNKGEK